MGTPKPGVVSMLLSGSGLAGTIAIAGRPSPCNLLLLRRISPGFSLFTGSFARSNTTILCSVSSHLCINVASIHALDPDFYKIPYVDGIPVGKRLKLWNLPPNCKHSELLEWFAGANVVVESLELTNDPGLNSQDIGGFVEFATKQDACIAIVRLDGYKFRGHFIRMDFAERRPRPNYASKRSRPNRNSSHRGSSTTSLCSPVQREMGLSNADSSSSMAQSIPRYGTSDSSTIQAPSDVGRIRNMGPWSSSSNGEGIQRKLANGNAQSSPAYGSEVVSAHHSLNTSTGHGSISNSSKGSSSIGEGSHHNTAIGNAPSSPVFGTMLSFAADSVTVQTSEGHGSCNSIPQVPRSFMSTEAPSMPGTTAEAPNFSVARQAISGVEDRSSSVIGQISPPFPYATDVKLQTGKLNSFDYLFKGYDAPDQAVVEPWSNKINFRPGPMYGSPEPSSFNRLLVSNMALSVDDATLHQIFSRFGTVLEARVLRDPESGRSRGLGVVAMSNVEQVKAAYKELDGWFLEGRCLKVDSVAQ